VPPGLSGVSVGIPEGHETVIATSDSPGAPDTWRQPGGAD